MRYCTVNSIKGRFDLVTEDQTQADAIAHVERICDETGIELQVWSEQEYLSYLETEATPANWRININ